MRFRVQPSERYWDNAAAEYRWTFPYIEGMFEPEERPKPGTPPSRYMRLVITDVEAATVAKAEEKLRSYIQP